MALTQIEDFDSAIAEEPILLKSISLNLKNSDDINWEEWNPTKWTFALAFLGISPFLFFLFYRFGFFLGLIFSIAHFASAPLAIKLQDKSHFIRWTCGFASVVILSGIKSKIFLNEMHLDSSLLMVSTVYTFTALWQSSNCGIIFGGRPMLKQYGITNYPRAFLAMLCPAQVKINNHRKVGTIEEQSMDKIYHYRFVMRTWIRVSLYFIFYCVLMVFLRNVSRFVIDFNMKHHIYDHQKKDTPILLKALVPIAEAEILVLLVSCVVNAWNIPSHFWQLCMIMFPNQHPCPVEVIYPFGAIYISTSSREFWSRWCRPIGSLIRQMVYHPMGGSRRLPYLSIPFIFFFNALSHYRYGHIEGWNLVFGSLGLVATLEVLIDKWFGAETSLSADQERKIPQWYATLRTIVAVISLRYAAYHFVHSCLELSLELLLSLL